MAKGLVIAGLSLMLQATAAAPPATTATTTPSGSSVEVATCDETASSDAPEAVILPTTGKTFTLPPDKNAAATPCPELPPPPVRPPAPNIFGSVALPVKSTALDWRWNDARTAPPLGTATPWAGIVSRATQLGDREKLAFVNGWINNNIRFAEDISRDHWASAAETFRNRAGDCEDFAIAKLTLLQDAGLPADSMFLVVVRDTMRNTDHAVLAVRLDGEMLVLDSRTDRILSSSVVADYRPIFSFGGQFAWTHGYERGAVSAPGK